MHRFICVTLLGLVATPAFAVTYYTTSGTPTSLTMYNSAASGTACSVSIGGYTMYVDDVSGNFASTCLMIGTARARSESITVEYYIDSGGTYWAVGAYDADTATSIDYIYTDYYAGSYSYDCKVYMNGTAGNAWYYVLDGGPEEGLTCGLLFAAQVDGRSWSTTYSTSSYELSSFMIK